MFLQHQLTWASMSKPVSAAFNAAGEGTGPILALRPSRIERGSLIDRARALAACDASTEQVGWDLLGACLSFLADIDRVITPTINKIPRREVRAAISAFRRDLARPWTITDVSRQVHLSAKQLTRLFNAEVGASPMRVLTRLRMERFAELLQVTDWNVQRCSAAVGWTHASHAAHMMKHMYGVTPSQYRQAARSRHF
ncbi:MAG: helix-turn-helix transcriptional regulator [Brevibacterium yomogidense]